MNVKEYKLALLISIVSILVIGSVTIYFLQNQRAAEKQLHFQYPSGTSSSINTLTLAQGSEQQTISNTISVSGSGTVFIQADDATITLGVQTEGSTASESVNSNAEIMTEVIDGIKTLGLTEEEMRTVAYNVYPLHSKEDYNIIVGYRLVNMIAVEVADMGIIGQVIDIATDNGANRIQDVSFGLSLEKQAELQTQAYVAALRDAEAKALLIASELEITITGVISVSENVYSPYQPYYDSRISYAGESTTTPIIEGKLSISVTVHVIYSFE